MIGIRHNAQTIPTAGTQIVPHDPHDPSPLRPLSMGGRVSQKAITGPSLSEAAPHGFPITVHRFHQLQHMAGRTIFGARPPSLLGRCGAAVAAYWWAMGEVWGKAWATTRGNGGEAAEPVVAVAVAVMVVAAAER